MPVPPEEARNERWFLTSYVNAEDILPRKLLDEVRQYFEGGAIYIPRSSPRAEWGSGSGMRAELDERNRAIRQAHGEGASPAELAARYCLSPDSIRKILQKT